MLVNTQHSGDILEKISVTVILFCLVAVTWLASALPITLPRMLVNRGLRGRQVRVLPNTSGSCYELTCTWPVHRTRTK